MVIVSGTILVTIVCTSPPPRAQCQCCSVARCTFWETFTRAPPHFPNPHCAAKLLHIRRGLNHGAAVKISRVNINNERWEGRMCHVPRDNVRADCDVSRAYTCNATNTDGQLVTIISQQLSSTLHQHHTLDTGLGVSHDGYLKTVRCAMHGLP